MFDYRIKLNDEPLVATIDMDIREKLEEALDEGNLHIPITVYDMQYKMFGLLEIEIFDDYDDSLYFAYLITHDTVSDISKEGFYEHNLTVIEYTHKLEKFYINALTFTQPLLRNGRAPFTNLETNEPNNFMIYFFNGIDIKENYLLDRVYTIKKVPHCYISEDDGSTYTQRSVFIETSDTSNGLQNLTDDDVEISFSTLGDHEIYIGYLNSSSQFIKVYTFYVQVFVETRYSLYDMIQRIRNVSPIESVTYHEQTRMFNVDEDLIDGFKKIFMPQMFIQHQSVRQTLNVVFKYINAISRLNYIKNNPDVLTVDYFNKIVGVFEKEGFLSYESSQDIRQYGSSGISFLEQALQTDFQNNPSIQTPSEGRSKVVRSETVQLTRDTFTLPLERENYQLNKITATIAWIKVTANNPNGDSVEYSNVELDITDRVINEVEWQLKDITVNFPTYNNVRLWKNGVGTRTERGENLYWKQFEKKIDLGLKIGDYEKSDLVITTITQAINEFLTLNLQPIRDSFGDIIPNRYDVTWGANSYIKTPAISDETAYRNIKFNIEYTTLENPTLKVHRENIQKYNYQSFMRFNQTQRMVNFSEISRNFYGQLQRSGVANYSFALIHDRLSDVLPLGSIDNDGFVIVERQFNLNNEYIVVHYSVSENHNRISEFMGINQEYRVWEIPQNKQVFERLDDYEDFVIITKDGITLNPELTRINDKAIELMFKRLVETTNDVQPTKVTATMFRSDGFERVYPDEANAFYGIMTPVNALGGKGGFVFKFGFDSNQVAGNVITKSEDDLNLYNHAIRYTDRTGVFEKAWFGMFSSYNETDVLDYDITELKTRFLGIPYRNEGLWEKFFLEESKYPLIKSGSSNLGQEYIFSCGDSIQKPYWKATEETDFDDVVYTNLCGTPPNYTYLPNPNDYELGDIVKISNGTFDTPCSSDPEELWVQIEGGSQDETVFTGFCGDFDSNDVTAIISPIGKVDGYIVRVFNGEDEGEGLVCQPPIVKYFEKQTIDVNDPIYYQLSYDYDSTYDPLIIYKDSSEKWGLSYQMSVLPLTYNDYVFGLMFFIDNRLVKNPETYTARNENLEIIHHYNDEPLFVYRYSQSSGVKYNTFDEKIKIGYTDSIQLVGGTNITYANNVVTLTGNADTSSFYSWAIGDEIGNLYIACNLENTNTIKAHKKHFRPQLEQIGNKTKSGLFLVNFYDWDDTLISTTFVVEGSDAVPPPNPTREPNETTIFQFSGWDTTLTNVVENLDVKALYSESTRYYVVTFKNYDGTILDADMVEYGGTATYEGPTPTRSSDVQYSYTFNGWSYPPTNITQDLVVTAQYTTTPIYYTVTYYNIDNEVIEQQTNKTYGSTTTPPSIPTVEGYTFTNWRDTYTDKGETTPSGNQVTSFIVSGNLNIYAYYMPKLYNVIFYHNMGGPENQIGDTVQVYHDKLIPESSIPTPPTFDNYTFDGWDRDLELPITGNTNIEALYEANKFDIVFYTLYPPITHVEYQASYLSNITLPTPTEREGYTFDGWFTQSSGGSKIGNSNDSVQVTGNITGYQQWTIQSYSVEFKVDGLQYGDIQYVNHGSYVSVPLEPTKTGYTFLGWGVSDIETYAIVENTVFTAQFAINTYQINFYTLYPPTTLVSYTAQHFQNITLPTPTAREGYDFNGWFTAESGGTKIGNANQTIQVTGAIQGYQQWTIQTFTVYFKVDGTNYDIRYNVPYGSSVEAPTPNPTKTGYTFLNWGVEDVSVVPITSDTTFTAQFSVTQYAVKFYDINGFQIGSTQTINYGSSASVPTPPTITGMTFSGWYSTSQSSGGGFAWSSGQLTSVTQNIDAYARYSDTQYLVQFVDWDSSPLKSEYVYYGQNATPPLNDPIRSSDIYFDYTFNGWDKSYTNIQNHTTITAQYLSSGRERTVYFDAVGGSVSPTSKLVYYGSAYGSLPTPSKVGSTFNNWQTFGGSVVTDSTTFLETTDITLYANWTEIQYTVTFKDWNNTVLKTQDVYYGQDATPPNNPTRTGYRFTGWGGTYTNVTTNVEVVAQYTALVWQETTNSAFSSTIDVGSSNSFCPIQSVWESYLPSVSSYNEGYIIRIRTFTNEGGPCDVIYYRAS